MKLTLSPNTLQDRIFRKVHLHYKIYDSGLPMKNLQYSD